MANEQNKAVALRGYDAFNTGELSIVDEIVADDAVGHDPSMEDTHGPDGFKQVIQVFRGAFPDLSFTIEECFSDGDFVCTRWTSEGTNDGELMGMPATGKHVTSSGISIDKVQHGRIVESWTQWDNLGLMQQLGLTEAAAATAG